VFPDPRVTKTCEETANEWCRENKNPHDVVKKVCGGIKYRHREREIERGGEREREREGEREREREVSE
jgi:hypothetical protein